MMKKVMPIKSENANKTRSTMMPTSKSTISSPVISVSVLRPLTSQDSSSPESKQVFNQRKAMKSAYEELFRALFQIPDKQVQQRVLDAINGVTTTPPAICVECIKRVKVKRETVHSATQTFMETESNGSYENEKSVGDAEASTFALLTEEKKEPTSSEPKSKKRKRKNILPRVMKQSHAQQHKKEQPQLNKCIASSAAKDIIEHKAAPIIENDEVSFGKRKRSDCENSLLMYVDSNISQCDALLEYINLEKYQKQQPQEGILRKVNDIMEKEFYESEKVDEIEGFLPIHKAICNNDMNRLRRQIYVWKRLKKTELSEVLTQHGEDCMEVALCNNSETKVVELILNAGYDINFVFQESSCNVLHLAIYNEVSLETVIFLAQKIDLSLLQNKNDAGHTPLFLALRQNSYLYFEAILQVMDERLNLKKYKREENSIISEVRKLKEFTKFYAQQCENIQIYFSDITHSGAEIERKLSILNECDPKSGNTMLLYAIEQKLDHFIYLLLAHLANPLVKNYCGNDARSFYSEYGRSYKLNVKIDKYLENVISTLQHLK